jgi:hypothetical protein
MCGEENLHRELRAFVRRYGFSNAPYPTSEDLMASLKAACHRDLWTKIEPNFRDPGRYLFSGFAPPPRKGEENNPRVMPGIAASPDMLEGDPD